MAAIKWSDVGKLLIATPPPVDEYPEAATQTFIRGDFVFSNAGYITICGADPAMILGLALSAGRNSAAAGTYNTLVRLAMDHVIFKMSVSHAVPANNVIEATDLFSSFGITRSAAGKWVVDKAKIGAAARVRVVKFFDAVGTEQGQVGVVILPANRSL